MRHCCKARHCCRDNSCGLVEEKSKPALLQPGGWIPEVTVKRGGVRFPRFRVETMVTRRRRRWFWQRKRWNLHVRYWDPAQHRNAHHIMEGFPAENLAINAAEIIKFMMQTINDQYQEERG